jgi:hypothetical protein
MTSIAVLILAAQVAYSAIRVVTYEGKTSRVHLYSDGVHTKTVYDDGTGGTFRDDSLQTTWQWGKSYGCIHMSTSPAPGSASTRSEEVLGKETVGGHPTQKVKVITTWTENGKTTTFTDVEWRASDLNNLVIRSETPDGQRKVHVEQIVLGKPDPKLLAFPDPPCNASEVAAIATAAPQAAGGSRTIRFDQGACEFMVALPIALSIPSDYSVKAVRPLGCFWGADDDLARMLRNPKEADFESIHRGVFWVRPSESTEYDPVHRRFVSEAGPQEKWADAYRAIGAKNVVVTPKSIGVFPAANVTLTSNGQRVYMLYLAIPNTDSIAVVINYRPAGKGSAADDTVWKSFVDSIREVKK